MTSHAINTQRDKEIVLQFSHRQISKYKNSHNRLFANIFHVHFGPQYVAAQIGFQ